jgi:Uma2 family endonuclease
MATNPVRRWTYREFAQLPDDGNRYEVIAGELYVTPAPGSIHQKIVTNLIKLLGPFVENHGLGELVLGIDVLFAEGDYLEPDLVFVRHDREEIIQKRGSEGSPDLVIEVLSDSTAARDRGLKRERYALYGVPEYWVLDPDARQIEVYRLREDQRLSQVVRDRLAWQPVAGGPVLEIDVEYVFRGFRHQFRA